MQIRSDCQTREGVLIQGSHFNVVEPFREGDTLNAAAASQLNQVFIENIRNNFAKVVKEVQGEGERELSETEVKDLQTTLDSYLLEYEFGMRSGGGFRAANPVEAKAMEIAKKVALEQFRKKGKKRKDVVGEELTLAAKALIERYPQITKRAEDEVKKMRSIEKDIMQDLGA